MSGGPGGPVLLAAGVRKSYGPVTALAGVDLEVHGGEIVALLGPNGAGKSSFASIVAGLRRPDAGEVRIAGFDVRRAPGPARRHLGYAPQELGIYPPLTVRDNLRLFAGLAGLRHREAAERMDRAAAVFGLEPLLERTALTLSGGEKRRLHAAAAVLHRPSLVLLDEPTVGVDVAGRAAVLEGVRALAREGAAVCYSTHYLREVEELGASVAILDQGRIIARGSVAALVAAHGGSAVELHFAGAPPPLDGAAALGGTGLRLPCRDAAGTLARVMGEMGAAAAGLRSVRVCEPDLESVFLRLTGRRYATAEEGPA